MQELNRMLEIKSKLLTAFHPQTDGQTKSIKTLNLTVEYTFNLKLISNT